MSEEAKNPTHVIVSVDVLNRVLNTLASLPYTQVAETIQAIQSDARPMNFPAAVPEETPEEAVNE